MERCKDCYYMEYEDYTYYCSIRGRLGEKTVVSPNGCCSKYKEIPNYDYRDNGGCFLTSACVDFMGKQDDCEELTLLRGFRDSYLASIEEGRKLIELYYNVAPQIVNKINERKNKNYYYQFIYNEILKCLDFIKNKENEKATAQYIYIVLKLGKELL